MAPSNMGSTGAAIGLLVLAASASAAAGLPQYLTWQELQARPIASQPGCKCASSSGLEGLVKQAGGDMCLPKSAEDAKGLTSWNASLCYPSDYGIGECRMWDAGHGACATETPAAWCFHFWCYVDPNDCNTGDIGESAFFNKAGLGGGQPHYSYMTCGVPQGGNPYFSLWIPGHIIAAAVVGGVLVPLLAFGVWRAICHFFPSGSVLGLPWMAMWITVVAERVINWLSLHTRVPNFPAKEFTGDIFAAQTLFFALLCVQRILDVVDANLLNLRYTRHNEQGSSKQMQILESVLLYKKLHVDGWADLLVNLWRPVYGVSRVALCLIWVLTVLELPLLTDIVTGGFVATFFLFGVGGLFSCKEDLIAAILLAIERPFKVADIISLHSCSNNQSNMNAIAVGFVEKLGLMHIHIRNFDMRLQLVPTSAFSKGTIKNWTAREYKLSHWTLVLSMRSDPEKVKLFRDESEHILKSHPSCKTDGYVKVCVGKVAGGGFEMEVICFTKPHADHHSFKLDMSMAFSKLASRLGIEFVWEGISRESSVANVPGFQFEFAGPHDTKASADDFKDLLFQGRFTRGTLVGKFKKVREIKLARGFEQAPGDASLSFDVMFAVPLTDPSVVADKEIIWTEDHPTMKGELTVMVDSGALQAIVPKGSILGSAPHEVFVIASVTKKGGKAQGGVAVDAGAGAAKLGGAGAELAHLHRAGDEVLAVCKSALRRLNKMGQVTWGETMQLGDVELQRPKGQADSADLVLQLVVGRAQGSGGAVEVLGTAEKPLLELVMDGWKDMRVKVEGASFKA